MIRNRHAGEQHLGGAAGSEGPEAPPAVAREPIFTGPLYLPRPVLLYPVEPDGQPGYLHLHGTLRELAGERVVLGLHRTFGILPRVLLMGVLDEPDRLYFAGVEVQTSSPGSNGQLLVEGRLGGPASELLQPKNLTPRFHFDSLTFTFGFPAEVLHQWAELGVLQSVVIDRLLLCPRCHGLPTFRSGCRQCGSAHVVWQSADPASNPDDCYCSDCHHRDRQLAPVNQCLHCEHRFFAHQGYEMVLQGYRARRLVEDDKGTS